MNVDIIKYNEVRKELGLNKKEITQIKIFDNSKYAFLWRFLLIIAMLLIIIVMYYILKVIFVMFFRIAR